MSREMRVLIDFIVEFNPFYTEAMLIDIDYKELVDIAKSVAEIL